MANAISIRSALSQHVYIALQMTETATDAVNNTSTVAWALKGWLEAANSAYWYSMSYHAISVSINNQVVYSLAATTNKTIGIGTTAASEASAVTIASGSITVTHNTDGTLSMPASFAMSYRWGGGSWSGSGSFTLTAFPRASTISVGTLTMGTAGTITITKASSSFTHTLKYYWGSSTTGTIATKTDATSVSWTPAVATFAPIIPNASQGQGTLVCETYNGNTKVGESSIVFTLKVPSSTAPSLSIADSRVRTTNTGITGYIQRVDKAKIALTATGQYGATITSYNTTVGSTSYSGSSFTTNTLSTAGTVTIKSTVTDSRGFTKTVSKNITVTAYSLPSITAVSAYRCASSTSTTASTTGAYICVKPTGSATKLTNNAFTCTVQYKVSTASSWTSVSVTDTSSDYKLSGEYVIFAATTTSAYDVRVVLADSFNSTTVNAAQVPTIENFISILKSGSTKVGMAIGKVVELTRRLNLGWGLTVQAGNNRDSGGSDIRVKNSTSAGVKVEETSSGAGIGLFVNSSKQRGLWDYNTGGLMLYRGTSDDVVIPSGTLSVPSVYTSGSTNMMGGNWISKAPRTDGAAGYFHMCRIVIKSGYSIAPYIFTCSYEYHATPLYIGVLFTSTSDTDPSLSRFWRGGADVACYIVKSATSTWDIYVKKADNYSTLTVNNINRQWQRGSNDTITYNFSQVSRLPSGYTTATELFTVNKTINSCKFNGQVATGAIELTTGTPYIDFHYGNSATDYTARIIENSKGVLTAYNSIASGSDARLKEDIQDIDDKYMQLVERLQGKTFHMKLTDEGTLSCGFVAQDVLAIEAELGIEQSLLVRNDGKEVPDTNDPEKVNINYYAIDYQAYSVLLGEYYRRKMEGVNQTLETLAKRLDALESGKDDNLSTENANEDAATEDTEAEIAVEEAKT